MSNPVLERLHRHGLRQRKELGQHFLADARVQARLVACIAPRPSEAILEYGAGLGVMTEALLDAGARVVAVELDDDLARVLEAELGGRAGFRLVHADLTRVSADSVRRDLGVPALVVVGNLPYQLTSHVLFGTLDLETGLDRAIFMVQREVAERIASPPGNRGTGILGVLLHAWHDVTIEMRVKPGAFAPPPRVDSAVVRIRPRAAGPALGWDERPAFTQLVKSVFAERRKVLRNTLRKFYELEPPVLAAVETTAAVDLGRRPESLAIDEFVRLLRALPESSGARVAEAS